ncbi:19877_t:CDS:1, partial [Gigaspora rosea]
MEEKNVIFFETLSYTSFVGLFGVRRLKKFHRLEVNYKLYIIDELTNRLD